MTRRTSTDVLSAREQDRLSRNTVLRTAIVKAGNAQTYTLTVTLGGTDVPNVPYLRSTGPRVGDAVAVLQTQAQLLVIGVIATPPTD